MNHLVLCSISPDKKVARVQISPVDRKFVPNRDFVLYFRDEDVNKPTGLVYTHSTGEQAVLISILPDVMSSTERLK